MKSLRSACCCITNGALWHLLPKIGGKGKGWWIPAFGCHLTFLKMSKTKTRQMALPKNALIKRLSTERDKSSMIASHKRASISPVEGGRCISGLTQNQALESSGR